MISILRAFTKSWIFQGVLVLLIASFAVYGLRDVFGSHPTNAVITAGSRTFADRDFKRAFDGYKRQLQQQNPNLDFTPDQFVAAGQHLLMVDQLADQVGLNAWLESIGVKPSSALLAKQLRNQPAFFNPVTGHFDTDAFHRYLNGIGLDETTFKQELSDDIATAQYSDASMAGMKAPRIAAVLNAAFTSQTRDASYLTLSADTVAKPGAPTDADLMAFYKAHAQQFSLPEFRQAVMVGFDPAQIAKTIPADEDALKKAYAAQQASLGTPEQRTFVEVTAPNADAANAIAAALRAGKSPDAVAAANGGKVVTYQSKAQADVPDTKVASAAFALKAGDVSGPVAGDLGLGVLKVTDVKPAAIPSYDSVRPKLLADYQQSKAADKINQMVNDFQKAHDAGEPFDTTVQKMGLKVMPLPPIAPDGRVYNSQMSYSGHMDIVKAIYDLQLNQSSDVTEMGGGVYYALKLVADRPAGPPPFESFKPQLTQMWTMDKTATAVAAQLGQVMTRVNAGEKLEKIAADIHAPMQTATGVDVRDSAKKVNNPQLTQNIFLAKPGETFQAQSDPAHVIVGRLDAVHQADPAAANAASAMLRPQFAGSFTQDVAGLTRKSARTTEKTQTYPDAAIRAINATPPSEQSSSSSKAKS